MKSHKEYRERLRREGKCTECTKPASDGTCEACKEKNRKRVQNYYEALKSGKCSRCSSPVVPGLSVCKICKENIKSDPVKSRMRTRQGIATKTAQRMSQGLCRDCPTPVVPGRTRCQRHIDYGEKHKDARRARGQCRWCPLPLVEGTQLCEEHHKKVQEYKKGYGRFSGARTKAKQRGVPFTLSREEYEAKVSLPCDYCGFPLRKMGTGLDQKIPGQGYTKENGIPCCRECNVAKLDQFSYDETKKILGPAIRQIKLQRLGLLVEVDPLLVSSHSDFAVSHSDFAVSA